MSFYPHLKELPLHQKPRTYSLRAALAIVRHKPTRQIRKTRQLQRTVATRSEALERQSFLPKLRWTRVALLAASSLLAPSLSSGSTPTIGFPVVRTYSIEEIGVSRGPQLDFDRLGRLAVISSGRYMVLNDRAWIDLADTSKRSGLDLLTVFVDQDGNSYFGALASWGKAEQNAQGRIEPVSMRPESYPSWINSTNFTQIIQVPSGILFSGSNGIVHLDPKSGAQTFAQLPVDIAFTIGSDVFVSSGVNGTLLFDPLSGLTQPVDAAMSVHDIAPIGDGRVVAAEFDGRVVFFDGTRFSDFDLDSGDTHRVRAIGAIEALPDGGFAVAVDNKGLFLFSKDGERKMALTSAGYRRIYDLAAREPGILWLARENSVEKLIYNDPVSVVDQRSNVLVAWPQVVNWKGQWVIASDGRLYDVLVSEDGSHYEFKEAPGFPTSGAWGLAASGQRLLVGKSDGLYERDENGFAQILSMNRADRVFMLEEDLCLAIGRNEIAALRWDGSAWSESAPRLEGVGYPSVVHQAGGSIWIELGLDRAARIWFEEGALHKQIYEEFPWEEPAWVNIGALKDHIVFSSAHNQRVYLDKHSGRVVDPPSLEKAIAQAPMVILRVFEDESGVIWATHAKGALTFHPEPGGYRIDLASLDSIRDQYPTIARVDGRHAWIATESALYHVSRDLGSSIKQELQPFLVSISDGKTGEQIFSAGEATQIQLDPLPYSQNHLDFLYFSGGYAFRQDPEYQFSMQSRSSKWTIKSRDSLLTLPSLQEGAYRLTAQLKDGDTPIGDPIVMSFKIEPPWYRNRWAIASYLLLAIAAALAVVRYTNKLHIRKAKQLQALVAARTHALESQARVLEKQNFELAEKSAELEVTTESLTQTLSQLEEAQGQLVTAARTAGKAEIAINVLHNVGNVLNSINVSLCTISRRVSTSSSNKLSKLAELIEKERHDIAAFLTTDPRGKHVPDYLINLARVLNKESVSFAHEISLIEEEVEHIKRIVAAQQTHAKAQSICEDVDLHELCDTAFAILGRNGRDSRIEATNQIPDGLVIHADKHRVLEILLNLVSNAQEAVVARRDLTRGTISTSASLDEDAKRVTLAVRDNGVGIDADAQKRIFTHGFTTKASGHGFGLHSAANAAKALGGNLNLTSPGPNQGAVATLTLPLAPHPTDSASASPAIPGAAERT